MIYDINNYKQNHPELVCRDLAELISSDTVRHVLKFRGINKWLRVRRLLIQLKSRWKDRINDLEKERKAAKKNRDYTLAAKLSGRKEQLADCRQQVRALCHSPRDVDFPDSASDFGKACVLPESFPQRPHKRWFWRN